MSRVRLAGGALLLAGLGLIGCAEPRFVAQDQSGGVIAMPSNSDYWPSHYRKKAEEMMARKCPQGYVIEHEEEVVVGQTVTNNDSADTQTQDVGYRRSDVQLTTTVNRHSTTAHDLTEYRIAFRVRTAPAPVVQLPVRTVPATPVMVRQPAGTLPSAPIPVGEGPGHAN